MGSSTRYKMENKINSILLKLQTNRYPGNSWGIAIDITDRIVLHAFDILPGLKEIISETKAHIPDVDPELVPSVQLIFNYKNDEWVIALEYLDPGVDSIIPDPNYSIIVNVTKKQIKDILKKLIASGVRIYDVACNDI